VSTKLEYTSKSEKDEDELLMRAILNNISRACNISCDLLNLAIDSTANEKQDTIDINYLGAAQKLIEKQTTYFKVGNFFNHYISAMEMNSIFFYANNLIKICSRSG